MEERTERVLNVTTSIVIKLRDRIEELEAKVEKLESEASRMNGGRSCKVCGQDYAIAELGETMGFRVDIALLENRRLQAKVKELTAALKEAIEWDWMTSVEDIPIEIVHLCCSPLKKGG